MKPSLKRLLLVAVLLPAGCTPPSSSDDAGVPAVFSASGSLVPGFGGGIVTSNPSGGNDEATAIVVDAEHFYVTGTQRGTGTSSEVQWRIEKRSLDDGALVASVTSDPSSSVDEPKAMATDGTALYVVGTENAVWRVEKRLLSDLSLVASFGSGGAVTNSTLSFFSAPAAMAIDASHMYIVGKDNNQWRIEKRRLDTGALETASFGANTGIVLSDPTFAGDEARAIAIDATFMYVAGVEGSAAWRIEKRSLATGELDLSGFGAMTGAVTIDPGTGSDEATSIVIDAEFFYVAGFDAPGFMLDRRWRIEKRSLSTGELETPVFGGGTGVVISDPSLGDDQPVSLILVPGAPTPSLLTVGFDEDGISKRWRVEKRDLSTGDLLAEFADGGVRVEDASSGDDRLLAAAPTVNLNQLVTAGFDSAEMDHQWRMSRWNIADGQLAPLGGVGVEVQYQPSAQWTPKSVAMDADSIYVAGPVERLVGDHSWRIERRNRSDGRLVYAKEAIDMHGERYVGGIAIDDTSLYIVGGTYLAGSSSNHSIIEKRNLSDGMPTVGFGIGGVIRLGTGERMQWEGVAVLAPYFYVTGWFENAQGEKTNYIEKRLVSDGSVETSFGVGGDILGDPGDGIGGPITIASPYLFIGFSSAGLRVEKRLLSDGSEAGGFYVYDSISSGMDYLVGISVIEDFIYIGGRGITESQNSLWVIQKRSVSTGDLQADFGAGGRSSSILEEGGPRAMVADASSAYIAGVAGGEWRIEKWNTADGRRSADFGVDGVISLRLRPDGADIARGMALSPEHLFIVGTQLDGYYSRIEKRLK